MRLVLYSVLLLALVLLGFTCYSTYAYRTPRDYAEQTILIPPGTGARGVVAQLHTAGLVPPLPVMAIPLLASQQHTALKAGEYFFRTGMSPAQMIATIARGDVVVHKLTIPEGWNSVAVRAALMNESLLAGDLPPVIAEGSVLPDTVHFTRGEARSNVLTRMQLAQQVLLAQLWNTRDPAIPITTPEEAVILASVVEKETGVAGERAQIAGVFTNRLRLGMKLQSDPTVVYGIELAQGGAPMGRALTRADLQRDTPHNSYTRAGLPPTPICNPGRAALAAVMRPAATDALYFVATGQGGHHFSATLDGHNQNVASYRQVINPVAAKPAVKGKPARPTPVKKRNARRKK